MPQSLKKLLALEIAHRIDAMRTCRKRALRGEDAESLHNLRVALRRLRSLTRPLQPLLTPRIRRIERRLKRLVQDTNALRDAEVHQQWLSRLAPDLPPPSPRRKDAARLRRALKSGRLKRDLNLLRERLPRQLAKTPKFALTRLLAGGCDAAQIELAHALSRSGFDDAAPQDLHNSRLLTKRVRYQAESYAVLLGDSRLALLATPCRELQDALGDLRDLEACAASLPQAEQKRAAARVRQARAECRERARLAWQDMHDRLAPAPLED
ncbi:CHAD domain-containing protein [Microvirgula aerodenitrificans]|uniref:CHAD domain-containing protein n=1 Tax=Microvirgula aerodenitrificans TaxID=57480 RepID=UPI00048E8E01|nr:CHAD domain-containing protein [Microvirgula aerodenitrificans]